MDVIGIGVQKAATTWLWRCLGEHPEIRISRRRRGDRKELNFFNRRWEQGYGWYEALFRPGPWRNLEFSTLYFHDAAVPERIHRYNPDARLLLALRNPVERASSHHRHEYSKGRLPESRQDFWSAAEWNPSYLEIGRYAIHLRRWLEWFPLERIHVVLYEDIQMDPEGALEGTFRFLEVDDAFRPPSTRRRVNEAVRSRVPGLNGWMRKASRAARAVLGEGTHRTLKATGAGRALRDRNRVKVEQGELPSLKGEDRARLIEAFGATNEQLAKMLGRDLSHWT